MSAIQKILARINGKIQQITPINVSTGAADGNKLFATSSDGKIHPSFLPQGIGPTLLVAPTTENLSAGNFVQTFTSEGVMKIRLADNSNGRAANGFVTEAVAIGENATVYPLDSINSNLTGLVAANDYWLGVAGGVIATPLDASDDLNTGKVCQYLGRASSVTELVTTDDTPVYL